MKSWGIGAIEEHLLLDLGHSEEDGGALELDKGISQEMSHEETYGVSILRSVSFLSSYDSRDASDSKSGLFSSVASGSASGADVGGAVGVGVGVGAGAGVGVGAGGYTVEAMHVASCLIRVTV